MVVVVAPFAMMDEVAAVMMELAALGVVLETYVTVSVSAMVTPPNVPLTTPVPVALGEVRTAE
jgi:hypothetical protein